MKFTVKELKQVVNEVLDEVSPPGWKGTTKAMKKHPDEIDNPFALAWYQKKKGDEPHYSSKSPYRKKKSESCDELSESIVTSDLSHLIAFANKWDSLSSMLKVQVMEVLKTPWEANVSPNAIKVAFEKIGGFNDELDAILQEYLEEYLEDKSVESGWV